MSQTYQSGKFFYNIFTLFMSLIGVNVTLLICDLIDTYDIFDFDIWLTIIF